MQYLKGLHTDNHPLAQPEGTYRQLTNGDLLVFKGAISNTIRRLNRAILPSSSNIIGHLNISESKTILFVAGENQIGVFENNTYTPLVTSPVLNFSTSHPVKATYIINNKGETEIFWTDNYNYPRYLNLSKIPVYLTETNLSLFPKVKNIPVIDSVDIDEYGGNLLSGTYQVAISLIGIDNGRTNYITISDPIIIVKDKLPIIDNFKGSKKGTITSKSLSISLSNLDDNYERIRVAIIDPNKSVRILPDIYYRGKNIISFRYNGNESYVEGNINEVLIDTLSYKTAKTLCQTDNTLYLANLTQEENINYQPFANNIKVYLEEKIISQNEVSFDVERFFADPTNNYKNRGFCNSEVYALYISLLMKDGTESQAFHIPGRIKDSTAISEEARATITVNNNIPSQANSSASVGFDLNYFINILSHTTLTLSNTYPVGDYLFRIFKKGSPLNSFYNLPITLQKETGGEELRNNLLTALSYSDLDAGWKITASEDKTIEIFSKFPSNDYNGFAFHFIAKPVLAAWDGTGTIPGNVSPYTSGADSKDENGDNYSVNFRLYKKNPPYVDIIEKEESFYILGNIDDNTDIEGIINSLVTQLNGDNSGPIVYSRDGLLLKATVKAAGNADYSRIELSYGNYLKESNFGKTFTSADTISFKIKSTPLTNEEPQIVTVNAGSTKEAVATAIGNLTFSNAIVESVVGNVVTLKHKSKGTLVENTSPQIYDMDYPIDITITKYISLSQSNPHQVEYQNVDSTHPLSQQLDFPIKNFHVNASPDPVYGMGYWENASEIYPDTDDWDIYNVVSGNTVDTGNTLRNEKVRHHRFPEFINKPYYINDGIEKKIRILGFRLEDIKLPTALQDRVVGYRVYYALKSPSNQLILESTTGLQGKRNLSKRPYQQYDYILEGFEGWVSHGYSPNKEIIPDKQVNWDTDNTILYFHPYDMFARDINTSAISYIRSCFVPQHKDNLSDESYTSIQKNIVIHPVKAAAYVDFNTQKTNLKQVGFSNDFYNYLGEKKLVIELLTPTEHYEQVYDICQIKQDVHLSFDNQELAYTGYTGTFDDEVSDPIFGGDTFVGSYLYKVNTPWNILNYKKWPASRSDGAIANDYWSDGAKITFAFIWNTSFGERMRYEEVKQVFGQMLVDSTLFYEVGQRRINASLRYEGTEEGEKVAVTSSPDIENYIVFYSNIIAKQYGYDVDNGKLRSIVRTYEGVTHPDLKILEEIGSQISSSPERTLAIINRYLEFYKKYDNYIGYNEEYSLSNILKPAFPSLKFEKLDYIFPTRVARSTRRDINSSLRTFLVSNYVDLAKDKGEINNIENFSDNIIIHFKNGISITRGSGELEVGEEKIYLGSGDVFANPLKDLGTSNSSFGGIESFKYASLNKAGYFWIDIQNNIILRLSDNLEVISDYGMRNFFKDAIFNRLPGEDLFIGFEESNNRLFVSLPTYAISYLSDLNIWESFHTFEAHRYFNNKGILYSVFDNIIYSHIPNVNYSVGVPYEFTLQVVLNKAPIESKELISIVLDSIMTKYAMVESIFETIDQIKIQTSSQDTGFLSLNPDNSGYPSIRRILDKWNITGFRVPTTNDFLPDWANKKRLEDQYHIVTIKKSFDEPSTFHVFFLDGNFRIKKR